MQLVATILAFFFLSLTVLPCTDEAPEGCSAEVHFHGGHGHDHEQEPHADFCSPFCACHCCHAHYLIKDFSYHSAEITYLGINIPYLSSGYTQLPPAVWQPPRV